MPVAGRHILVIGEDGALVRRWRKWLAAAGAEVVNPATLPDVDAIVIQSTAEEAVPRVDRLRLAYPTAPIIFIVHDATDVLVNRLLEKGAAEVLVERSLAESKVIAAVERGFSRQRAWQTPGDPAGSQPSISTTTDLILVYDPAESAIVFGNRPVWLGYESDSLPGQRFLTQAVHSRDQRRVRRYWQQIENDDVPAAPLVFQLRGPGGRWEAVTIHATPIPPQPERAGRQWLITLSATAQPIFEPHVHHDARGLDHLNLITHAAATIPDMEPMMQTLADRLSDLLDADICLIDLWDEVQKRVRPAAASDAYHALYRQQRYEPGAKTLTTAVLQDRCPLVVDSATAPKLTDHIRPFRPVTTLLALPLLAGEQPLGAVQFGFESRRRLHDADIALAQQASSQIALAVAKARSFEATRRQLEEFKALQALAAAGAEATSENQLLGEATAIIARSLYSDNFGILMLDDSGQKLIPHQSYHAGNAATPMRSLNVGEGVTGLVARTGRAVRVGDVTTEPDYVGFDPDTRSELCVPMQSDGLVIGVINAESYLPEHFTDADERLLTTFARQLATAIVKIRLLESERQRRREAETLHEASFALTQTLDLEQLLDRILSQLKTVVDYDSVGLSLLEGDRLTVVAARGFDDDEAVIGLTWGSDNALFQAIKEAGEPLTLRDAQEDPRFDRFEGFRNIHGWLGVPLKVRDETIGLLTIDSYEPDAYGPDDAALAQTLANQAAIAVENARLFEAAKERAEQLAALYEIQVDITAADELDGLLLTIVEHATNLVRASGGLLYLVDQAKREARCVVSHGNERDYVGITLPFGEGIAGSVAKSGEPITVGDYQNSPYRVSKIADDDPNESVMAAPLLWQGQVTGVLMALGTGKNKFSSPQMDLLTLFASQAAVAVQNARLVARTQQRADELTALVELSSRLRSAETADEMLPAILEQVTSIVVCKTTAVFLRDEEDGRMVLAAARPVTARPDYSATVLASDMPEAGLALPLLSGGNVIGILHVALSEARPFLGEEVRLLTAIAEMAGSALQRARVMETLESRVAERTAELAAANRRLTELDHLKSKFVSDVSHELRTPVTNLGLYVELLANGKAEKRARYYQVVQQETERLGKLIEDILNLSRLDLGKIRPELEPVDLNTIVGKVVALHEPRAEAANLTLTFEPDVSLRPVLGEWNQLAQVVTHMVGNALNYTPNGGVHLATSYDATRNQICLEVTDTGVGIASEDLPHLFERFYRGAHASQSNIPGNGLGLAIVEEIVKLHGGQVEVDTEYGPGARFLLWLQPAEGVTTAVDIAAAPALN